MTEYPSFEVYHTDDGDVADALAGYLDSIGCSGADVRSSRADLAGSHHTVYLTDWGTAVEGWGWVATYRVAPAVR